MKAAKTGISAASVVVAGPIVSFLPLGLLTPIVSILVTSFASSQLNQRTIGSAMAFLYAGGLRSFEGQLLALLGFFSFCSIFGKGAFISIILLTS
jgi:hypothetical protein